MKKQERRKFNNIMNYFYATGKRTFGSSEVGCTYNDLLYLAGRRLVILTPYVNGDEDCRVRISDNAFVYTEDAFFDSLKFWLPLCLSVISLAISVLNTATDLLPKLFGILK